jgi:hypothetical protein
LAHYVVGARSRTSLEYDAALPNQTRGKEAPLATGGRLCDWIQFEGSISLPWMKEELTAVKEQELSQAFATVMDELEKDRKTVAKLGDSIVSLTNQFNQSLFSIMNTLLTKAFSFHSFRSRIPKWRAI